MQDIFLVVLNMSITAGYCVIAVILLRWLLKKLPKIYSYVLWPVVFFRLMCPVSIKSVFSLLRINTKVMNKDLVSDIVIWTKTGYDAVKTIGNRADSEVNEIVNNTILANGTANWTASDVVANTDIAVPAADMAQRILTITAVVWLIVLSGLIIYGLASAIRLKKSLKNAVHKEKNIYEVKGLEIPFVFGVLKPAIYVPDSLGEAERYFVLKHELKHIARKDYIIKPVAFFIVCVHWFNPLAWLAFYLMSKDMEMSCDESVIRKLTSEERADYSKTLLVIASGIRTFGITPLAFSEGNVKDRIKNVLGYKKLSVWAAGILAVVLTAAVIGLALNSEGSGSVEKGAEAEAESSIDIIEPEEAIRKYFDNMGYSIKNSNVISARVLEIIEIDFDDAKDSFLQYDYYENAIVKTYAVCVDYSTSEDTWQYAEGIEYDVVSLKLRDTGWRVEECQNTNTDVTVLVNKGYALSKEYVDAAIEKYNRFYNIDYSYYYELDKTYHGDAVMYYDMDERIVAGKRLKTVNDNDYNINNLIKVSYYEQTGSSLYCYEADMKTSDGYEYVSYKLLLEHNGVYQVFTQDNNIYFGNIFGYDSLLPDMYDRDFDKGCEMDYDGDGELELAEAIMQNIGSGGYEDYVIAAFDYNYEAGLYDFYYIDYYDFSDMVEAAAKEFIDEYYGDYSINENCYYIFDDGYSITVDNNNSVKIRDDGSFDIYTTVWGNPWSEGEGMYGLGNEIGTVIFNVRYIGEGQFAVNAYEYCQWQ